MTGSENPELIRPSLLTRGSRFAPLQEVRSMNDAPARSQILTDQIWTLPSHYSRGERVGNRLFLPCERNPRTT